ncbi:procathepsin L-like [Bolinopsis microptera]|uniref:procathepsin L-like n=1 Tax=Bolinopsis microptera TaxID=2820187 RepID=UPI00307AB564
MHVASSLSSPPEKKLWTNDGKVTAVKNQGSCGSCWTFGAVGGLETRYHEVSGKLRNFAEQEYLDCVYEGQRNGCNGGWPDNCYDYSKKNGGRLASTADYGYTQKDGSCKGSSKPDAMVAAKIVGYTRVSPTEAANIEALTTGSLSVAFEVTSYFQQYREGIIQDTTCTGRPNHAVTAVGYTPKFVLVKNSWGSKWGESGFVKFSRGYPSNCGLFKYSSYPNLDTTGQSDNTPSDKATDYKPSENDDDNPNPKPDPNCKDVATNCQLNWCTRRESNWVAIVKKYCRKTCKLCGDDGDDGECPSGTIRCSDGVCRHEHMC